MKRITGPCCRSGSGFTAANWREDRARIFVSLFLFFSQKEGPADPFSFYEFFFESKSIIPLRVAFRNSNRKKERNDSWLEEKNEKKKKQERRNGKEKKIRAGIFGTNDGGV